MKVAAGQRASVAFQREEGVIRRDRVFLELRSVSGPPACTVHLCSEMTVFPSLIVTGS